MRELGEPDHIAEAMEEVNTAAMMRELTPGEIKKHAAQLLEEYSRVPSEERNLKPVESMIADINGNRVSEDPRDPTATFSEPDYSYLQEIFAEKLAPLTAEERKAISLSLGLFAGGSRSVEAGAREMNITPEEFQNLLESGFAKARTPQEDSQA